MKENKITTIRLYEDDLETIEKMKKYVKETWNIDLETAAIIRMALRELENIYIKNIKTVHKSMVFFCWKW